MRTGRAFPASGGRRPSSSGWTYLAMLVLLSGVSAAAAYLLRLGEIHGQRDAEAELLRIGEEFTRAFQSYAAATPTGMPRRPMTLQDLTRDPRYPDVVRHIRRIREDPITRKSDWALIRDAQGAIAGIHSASTLAPIRQLGPNAAERSSLSNRPSYADWVFWTMPHLNQ
jgi:hypothetical protein